MSEPEPKHLKLDLVELVGGALAAVSAAFVASTLGVAGTLLGAAVMSVVAAIGGALYTHSLAQAHARVRRRRPAPTGGPAPAGHAPSARRLLPWRQVAGMAGVVFVLALSAITAIELTTHIPLADLVRRPAAEQAGPVAAEQPATSLGKLLRPVRKAGQAITPDPTARDQALARPVPTAAAEAPTPTEARERDRTPDASAEPQATAEAEPPARPKASPTPPATDASDPNSQP